MINFCVLLYQSSLWLQNINRILPLLLTGKENRAEPPQLAAPTRNGKLGSSERPNSGQQSVRRQRGSVFTLEMFHSPSLWYCVLTQKNRNSQHDIALY